jgi:hypothetical protein
MVVGAPRVSSLAAVVVADTLARVLSILSLALGGVGTVVAVMAFRRDRPRLALDWGVTFSPNAQHLEVTIMNDGRQPTVVEDVSIQDVPRRRQPRRRYPWPLRRLIAALRSEPLLGGSAVLADGDPRSVLLRPGAAHTYAFSLGRLQELARADALYISAIDPLGREVTEPLPVYSIADAVEAAAVADSMFEGE